jgi:hypothetical protein
MSWKDSILQAAFLTALVFFAKSLTELIFLLFEVIFNK